MNFNPIDIYNIAVKRAPAYKQFLLKKSGKIPAVKTIDEFKKLPLTNKKGYILKYKLADLCLDGTLGGKHFIYASSGTTGKPVYWLKLPQEEKDIPHWLGLGLEEAHNISKIRTLIIVGLGLGSWVSGEQTSWAMRSLAIENKNITVITPGTNVKEILEIIKKFCPLFPQTLLISYPPFAKVILDKAVQKHLPLKKYNLKLGLVGEGYSEIFRNYAGKILGHKKQDLMAIWSGYGSADFGAVGRETPLTIAIRRILDCRDRSSRRCVGIPYPEDTIGAGRPVPTICQYSPASQYIETVNGELVISKFQAVPLVRYKTGDRGEIIAYKDFIKRLKDEGIDVIKLFRKRGFRGKITELPFVLVYGRIDGAVTFYGLNITIEQIKEILEKPELRKYFTGRFFMCVQQDKKLNPVFKIVLEFNEKPLKRFFTGADKNTTAKIIALELIKSNSEYERVLKEQGKHALPKIKFVEYGYFDKGIKIKYADK